MNVWLPRSLVGYTEYFSREFVHLNVAHDSSSLESEKKTITAVRCLDVRTRRLILKIRRPWLSSDIGRTYVEHSSGKEGRVRS